jgi:hypothetical protein
MDPLLSHMIAFLVGALTGATGSYLADRFTDQRRRQEKHRESNEAFGRIRATMPELIADIKNDLADPDNRTVREFFVAPSRSVTINSSQTRLIYYETDHPDLRGKVNILASSGYVSDVTTGSIPIFRMTEDFVARVAGV